MKKVYLSFVACVFTILVSGQVTFQKTYDIATGDLFSRVIQCTDHGYMIAGRDFSGMLDMKSSLIKTDTAGVVQWANNYSSNETVTITSMYFMNDMKQTSDGGYIITGNASVSAMMTSYDDLFLIKLTSAGVVSWAKGYGGGDSETGNYVIQTSDGGYLAVGSTYSFGTKDSTNIYMVKTNSSGTFQWDKTFQVSTNGDDYANCVAEHSAGYILTGSTEQIFAGVDTTTDMVVIGTDLNGNNPWVKTFGTDAHSESGNAIVSTSATTLVITGSSSEPCTGLDASDLFMMEISTAGAVNWCSAYDLGFADEGQFMQITATSGYTVIGFTIAALMPLTLKSFLIKVQGNGNIVWARRYGTGMSFNIFSSGQQTHDGGYVIGSIGTMGYDYYLMKADPNGYTGCNEEDVTATKRPYGPAAESPAYTSYTGSTSRNMNTKVTAVTPAQTTLCIEIPCDTPTVVITPTATTICSGQSVTLTASGADTYSWNTGATTAAITVSPTSNTTYTVTGMTGGICPSYPTSITITVNPAPNAAITGDNSICTGESTTLTASGGGTYLWTGGSTNTSITVNPASNTTYYVTVTGSNGCTATASSLVTVNALPSAAISGTLNICEGNSTTLTATGGNSYSWSSGQSTDVITVSPTSNTTYIVTVTNTTTGCSSTASATVNVTPVPNITVTGDTVLCVGESTTLTANGGDSYAWSTGDNTASTTITPGSTTTYTVTVTIIASGCTNTINQTVHVNTIPVVTFTGDTEICIGENTTVTANGADSYLWEGGGANPLTVNPTVSTYYTVTATNGSTACSSIDSVLITVNSLPIINITGVDTICLGESTTLTASGADDYLWSSGDITAFTVVNPVITTIYYVTATDNTTGCSDTENYEVYVNQLPDIQFSGDTSLCLGDITTITATGGDDFLWSTGGTYDTIIVSPSADASYFITVTDNITGCVNYDTLTVYVHDYPIATAGTSTTVCEGVPVQLTSSGGVTYTWSPSAGLDDPTISNPVATPSLTTVYIVSVANQFGCIDTASVTVTINPAPVVLLSGENISCNGLSDGSAWVSSVSGISPFTYDWSNGGNDTIITGIAAGDYYVTVTDGIGCSSVEMINIAEPAQLSHTEIVSNVTCYGYPDGSITINPAGGTSPYTYNWSNGITVNVNNGIVAGMYSVTVTDANGCILIIPNIILLQPDSMFVDVTENDASCFGEPNGNASLVADGGTPPYTYLWSDGSDEHTMTNVGSGLYYFTVTDGNGCKIVNFVTIQQPTDIIISDSILVNPSCAQADDGAICPQIFGGVQPYTFLWSNNAVSQCISNLSSDTYELIVTDFNNCKDTVEYILSGGTESCLLIPTFFSPNGDGVNDGWEIRGIQYFPAIEIEIFSRWGDVIYEYSGSGSGYLSDMWDGTFNGKELPISSYIFILTLNDGNEPLQGIVTIKK